MSDRYAPLELWAGMECTVNRVQDRFFDQMERAGHFARLREDTARVADLGVRVLRTAVHWERYAETKSWSCGDALMQAVQEAGIRPIVGLVHHGSGPRGTDLLDPHFPEHLAAYARRVAERYPEVTDYTPVNEPQTTGRFACLYGYWYPHHRSMRSYLRALVNQIKGIALSMEAIRAVQPEARLVHTEDGGATYSTPQLESFRVEREQRRWLGTDLLVGCVTREHPLFGFLLAHGITEREVLWFHDHPCPPSVLGMNYYVTSDRYLDHRLELYPWGPGGDTGDEPLIDAEAVRARPEGITGAGEILRQAWERYHLPLAVTEAHLGCGDAQEQVRWLAEVWEGAEAARRAGADVRAVTAWAVLGSYEWSNLCTRETGDYESGVFDLSSGRPEATPLTALVHRLAQGLAPNRAARERGWWRRPDRLTIRPYSEEHDDAVALT